jgi:hypothetical protein
MCFAGHCLILAHQLHRWDIPDLCQLLPAALIAHHTFSAAVCSKQQSWSEADTSEGRKAGTHTGVWGKRLARQHSQRRQSPEAIPVTGCNLRAPGPPSATRLTAAAAL